ncbi:hypothetical protein [Anaeromyxobacter diazotrophicus]|uniref:Transmembrane anti-sigma factor n=1 Tax=Anaeromyxobacter diazotrophicus TaxID=2590199 RepID=A0A7I9VIE0_9BACT|nr:hypothetical protein [Anaeromyxobacter diazotrophicus]GEJ55777.1 hypothetical protein AMYX_05180 [Anaeromyxobacter diazotrophicus]
MSRPAILPMALAALAAAAVVVAGAALQRQGAERRAAPARLVTELVNDHLRVLAAARPVELESGDAHALKPWLAGRLEFAPAVPADGGELHLRGAAVGYVFDRKAAVLVYRLRLHQLTLLAFPAGGLAWPGGASDAGPPRLDQAGERGFRAVLWRVGDLGYALVSDSNPEELARLARRLAAATAGGAGE